MVTPLSSEYAPAMAVAGAAEGVDEGAGVAPPHKGGPPPDPDGDATVEFNPEKDGAGFTWEHARCIGARAGAVAIREDAADKLAELAQQEVTRIVTQAAAVAARPAANASASGGDGDDAASARSKDRGVVTVTLADVVAVSSTTLFGTGRLGQVLQRGVVQPMGAATARKHLLVWEEAAARERADADAAAEELPRAVENLDDLNVVRVCPRPCIFRRAFS